MEIFVFLITNHSTLKLNKKNHLDRSIEVRKTISNLFQSLNLSIPSFTILSGFRVLTVIEYTACGHLLCLLCNIFCALMRAKLFPLIFKKMFVHNPIKNPVFKHLNLVGGYFIRSDHVQDVAELPIHNAVLWLLK